MIIRIKVSHLVLFLSLFCFVACKSSEKAAKEIQQETTAYKDLTQKWGGEAKYDFNEDRSLVLAQSVPAANAKDLSISYFVFDMKTEKVLTEGTARGSVQWLSPKTIEVFNTPGKMAPNTTRDDYTEVIDVCTGVRTPKTEWNK